MNPNDNTDEENRKQKTLDRLNNLMDWPFPKIALKRNDTNQVKYARGIGYSDLNCSKVQSDSWHIHEKNGQVTEKEFGILLNIYNSIEELLNDGWRLD